ncbi:hypothetical protein Y032_0401g776 [Ancylostoma ceylanicum]|uniref:Uncharacterized protein n=1 Tax=Ancylostoma ceylanicum TaxID=53326 RepID=A0A016X398_9BILA|nr:hypothetical protein Y032_0401g776 [Ancylostoma ceylanicum]
MEGPPDPDPSSLTDLATVKSSDIATSFSRVPAEFQTISPIVDDTAIDTSPTLDDDSDAQAKPESICEISPASFLAPTTTVHSHTEGYYVIDMDTSTTPPSSPSRVSADSYPTPNRQHLDLSEEALLASDDDSPQVRSLAETVVASFPLVPPVFTAAHEGADVSGTAHAALRNSIHH